MTFVAIPDSICEDERLALLSDKAERFFVRLASKADAHGRITANADVLNGTLWPLLRLTPAMAKKCLDECVKAGVLEIREAAGLRWIQVLSWDETYRQVGSAPSKRPKSKYPDSGGNPIGMGSGCNGVQPAVTPSQLSGAVRCGDDAGAVRCSEGDERPSGSAPPPPPVASPKASQPWPEVLARPEYAPLRASEEFMADRGKLRSWPEWVAECANPSKGGRKRVVPAGARAAAMLNQALAQHAAGTLSRYCDAIEQAIRRGYETVDVDYLGRDSAAPSTNGAPRRSRAAESNERARNWTENRLQELFGDRAKDEPREVEVEAESSRETA